MPTYPTTPRFFRDDEFRNENAAISGVVRAIAQGQNYRYARDLHVTPSDAKVFGELGWPWSASSLAWSPVHQFGSGGGRAAFGCFAEVLVPDPRSPATRVEFWLRVELSAVGAVVGQIDITNATTGKVTTTAISGAVTPYDVVVVVDARAGDVLHLSASWTSGVNFTVLGYSAFWQPDSLSLPGATFSAAWSALSQAFHATNAPLSTYALRWLGRSANSLAYYRPLQVAAAWLHNPAAGTAAGYNAYPTVVGRYHLANSNLSPSIVVRLRYRASGACAVDVSVLGISIGTVTIPGAGTGVATATIGLALGFSEVVLTVTGSPAYCDIEHVHIYESLGTVTSLGLPSGETVPAVFDPNLDERISSGKAIRADDIARLVANEVWLAAYRKARVLVNDCRFTYQESVGTSFTGAQGLTDRSALHELHTSKWDGSVTPREFRIRTGWHQGTGLGKPVPWEAWKFQTGLNTFSDSVGAAAIGLGIQYPEGPKVDWASFGQEAHQHRRGGVVLDDSNYLVETVLLTAGHTAGVGRSTRPAWMVLEELPLGAPAATYP